MPKFCRRREHSQPSSEAGYDVKTVPEVASAGIRNFELAELSTKIGRVVLSRDADFTRLKRSLINHVKVIYIQLDGEPEQVAELVLNTLHDAWGFYEGKMLSC